MCNNNINKKITCYTLDIQKSIQIKSLVFESDRIKKKLLHVTLWTSKNQSKLNRMYLNRIGSDFFYYMLHFGHPKINPN